MKKLLVFILLLCAVHKVLSAQSKVNLFLGDRIDYSKIELVGDDSEVIIYNFLFNNAFELITPLDGKDYELKTCSVISVPNYKDTKVRWKKISQNDLPDNLVKIQDLNKTLGNQIKSNPINRKFEIVLYKKENKQIFKCISRVLLRFFELSNEFILYPTDNNYFNISLNAVPFSISEYNKIRKKYLIPNYIFGAYHNLTNKINITGNNYLDYSKHLVFDCWMLPYDVIDGTNDLDLYHFIYFKGIGIVNIEKSSLEGLNLNEDKFEYFKIRKINGRKPNLILKNYLK